MRIDQAGHQHAAAAIDHGPVGLGRGIAGIDRSDPVAIDQDLGILLQVVGFAVEQPDLPEQDLARGALALREGRCRCREQGCSACQQAAARQGLQATRRLHEHRAVAAAAAVMNQMLILLAHADHVPLLGNRVTV